MNFISAKIWINLGTSVLAGVIVTVVVLITRIIFYRILIALPAGALFQGIKNVSDTCLVFIRRMTDPEKRGKFKTPRPNYSSVFDNSKTPYAMEFDNNQNIPWVTSTATAQAIAHVLNVLGRVGRTSNIELTYHDKDYDKWDSPMFIIGGGWKRNRATDTCNPYFKLTKEGFILVETKELFKPELNDEDEDFGLLQKTINPTNGNPIWIIDGYRGLGVVAASYCLVRWWKYLGWIYGKKPFALIVRVNDKDGWQQCHIIRLHPKVNWKTKIKHPYSWNVLKKMYQ